MRTIVLAFGRDANGELGRGEAAEDPPERGPTAAAGCDEPAVLGELRAPACAKIVSKPGMRPTCGGGTILAGAAL